MSLAEPISPTPEPGIGHNSGAAEAWDDFAERIGEFLRGGDVWAGRPALDDELAPRARDFVAGAKKLRKQADEARAAAKKPYADAAKAVDESWKPLLERLDKVVALVTPKLESYLRVQREAAEAAARQAQARQREAEAAEADARADALSANTESGRILAEERAEAAAREHEQARRAETQANAPVRVESATGLANRMGLRRQRVARLTSLPLAVSHFKDAPELRECLERLANAQARAAGIGAEIAIPGFEFDMVEKI